jgi:hypothetical protein
MKQQIFSKMFHHIKDTDAGYKMSNYDLQLSFERFFEIMEKVAFNNEHVSLLNFQHISLPQKCSKRLEMKNKKKL